jgi:SPP1 gp7 family putative phage head morphogenesis protein
MNDYHRNSDKTIRIITKAYDKAIKDIEEEIQKIFDKFARDGELSPEEAKQILNEKVSNKELDEIRGIAYTTEDKEIKKYLISRFNAQAYKARITRLEALKEKAYVECKKIADIEIQASEKQYIDTINQAYHRNIFDIHKGLGIGFDFASISSKTIEQILKNPWNGKHFSKRIWKNTDILAGKLTEIITSGLMSGKSYYKMAKELEEYTEYGKYAAMRLVRTETTYMANMAEIESYKECGIEKYIYVATLDLRTSETCQELDRKIFKVSEAEPGKNLPPMHPNCRSTTRSYISEEELKKIKRRARDPKTGKTYLVPGDMKYKEWYKKYVEGKYGQDQAEVMKKKTVNKSSDKKQHEKYKDILGKEMPDSFDKFQDMKYNKIKEWEDIKAKKQDTLNSLDYRDSFFGRFGNKEVREWYIAHDKNIPNLIDKSRDIGAQAREAHDLRNKYRTEARMMMKDREGAGGLNKRHPNPTFDELLEHKKNKYGLEGEKAYKDIIRSSQTSNRKVNEKLGIE